MIYFKPRKLIGLTAAAVIIIAVWSASLVADDSPARTSEQMRLEKAEHEARMKARQDSQRRSAAFRPEMIPGPPVSQPEAAWELGIFADREAPLPSSQYHFASRWVGIVSDEYVVVHAGALAEDPMQGVLAVFTYPRDNPSGPTSFDAYRSDLKAGSLQITSAHGDILTVNTATGAQLRFDVASRLFLDR